MAFVVEIDGSQGLAFLGGVDHHQVFVNRRGTARARGDLVEVSPHQHLAFQLRRERKLTLALTRLARAFACPLAQQEAARGPGIVVARGLERRTQKCHGDDE